jgi:hypothetical protein
MVKKLILFILSVLLLAGFVNAAGTIVDSVGIVGRDTSLDLNSLDRPGISYYDASNYSLKYAYWDGSSWNLETVDTGVALKSIGLESSLAFIGNNPAIAYKNATTFLESIKYAKWNGASWDITIVESSRGVGAEISLAIDSSNLPHISYYDSYLDDLKYATYNGTHWNNETVASTGDVGKGTSIAVDSSNNPHIAYQDNTNKNLMYITKSGGSWTTPVAIDTNNAGAYTSIVLDSSEYPRIAYLGNGDLKYARWNGASWVITSVSTDFPYTVSMDLETGTDYPHISYFESVGLDLKYARWTGTSWDIQILDSTGDVGKENSLKLDQSKNAHISYSDFTNSDLKYIMVAPPAPTTYSFSGMKLPDNSWGLKFYYSNGLFYQGCGNWNGNVATFNGIVTGCTIPTSFAVGNKLEICKYCWQSQPTKWGWLFENLNIASDVANDLSSALYSVVVGAGTNVGILNSAWIGTNGLADRLYGNALSSGTIELELLSDTSTLYKCDDPTVTACVDITSNGGVSKLSSYTWQIPATGAFSNHPNPLGAPPLPEFSNLVGIVTIIAVVAFVFFMLKRR